MPRTKLDKAFGNSAKVTLVTEVAPKAQPDDIMADFQVPDELRKQLEYPAQQKKRQLAMEHIEKKLTERLAQINIRLKEDRTRVSIQRVGGALVLQATLPLKPDEPSKDGSPNKQTKISLGIPFNADGLKTAEEEARELGKLIARKTFEWSEKYLGSKAPKPEVVPTIGELLEQFEGKYFMNRKKNRQSEITFQQYKQRLHKYLPLDKPLSDSLLIETIEEAKAGTAERRALVSALSVFCNTFEFSFNFKGRKNGYKPKKRRLPTDKEIEEGFYKFGFKKRNVQYQREEWQWVYGMLATYGLRPHEVFAIHIESFIDPANTLYELKLDETTIEGIKTGERTVFPLHPHWIELFDLKNVKLPKTKAHFESRTIIIGDKFRDNKLGFPPYNLRHAYAIRGHELGVPIKEMADNMGHSVDMHTETYQKYMTIDSRRIVYQRAIAKADEARNEQEAIEVLKANLAEAETSNAMLNAQVASQQAEIESLRALLIKHQLGELLNG